MGVWIFPFVSSKRKTWQGAASSSFADGLGCRVVPLPKIRPGLEGKPEHAHYLYDLPAWPLGWIMF